MKFVFCLLISVLLTGCFPSSVKPLQPANIQPIDISRLSIFQDGMRLETHDRENIYLAKQAPGLNELAVYRLIEPDQRWDYGHNAVIFPTRKKDTFIARIKEPGKDFYLYYGLQINGDQLQIMFAENDEEVDSWKDVETALLMPISKEQEKDLTMNLFAKVKIGSKTWQQLNQAGLTILFRHTSGTTRKP